MTCRDATLPAALVAVALTCFGPPSATAEECANPDALGTSRTVAVDAGAFPRIGFMQYPLMVELAPKEVILTFDDGPLPPMTTSVLETLKRECVKATFFIVGRMARAYPTILRRIAAEGHTIATHSQTHPIIFPKLSYERGIREIEDGFASINGVLAEDGRRAAPWFRFPGLGRTQAFETYLEAKKISAMSADFTVDDWLHLKSDEVMRRGLERLEARGRGMMLLHDIQPATAGMLAQMLRTLKARGYRIVHMVPAGTPGVQAAVAERGRGRDPGPRTKAGDQTADTAGAPDSIRARATQRQARAGDPPFAPVRVYLPPPELAPQGDPATTGALPPEIYGRDKSQIVGPHEPYWPSIIVRDLRGPIQ